MQESTTFLLNVTSWIVSSASQGSEGFLTSLLTHTPSTIISDNMTYAPGTITAGEMTHSPSTVNSEQMTYSPSTVASEQMTSSPSKVASEQMTSSPSKVASEQMTYWPSTFVSEPMTSSHSTVTPEQMTSSHSTGTPEQMTSSHSTVAFEQMTYLPSTFVFEQMKSSHSTVTPEQMASSHSTVTSEQMTSLHSTVASELMMTSPASIFSNQLTASGSSAATESLSSTAHNDFQVTPYTGSVTTPTSPSTSLMPSVGDSVSTGTLHQYSSTFTSTFNESTQMTQILSPSGNATVPSSVSSSSTSFPVELTSSLSGSALTSQASSGSPFPTSFSATPSYSNVTSTVTGSYPSETLTQLLSTSMMQTEMYVSDGVTHSLTDLNSSLASDFSSLNISNVLPTATETASSINATDTFNAYNSTLELPQISQTLVESSSTLESPYGESTSAHYENINATESAHYESTTIDFGNVTEEVPYENSTAVTEIWNTTTEAETTTLNTTSLTTLKTSAKTTTVTTTTARTTTRPTTMSSTTEVPIEEYSLTVPVIIGITVGLVVLTALIFVILLWRRKAKQEQGVHIPRRYSVNATKSSSFKHQSFYGRGRLGEHNHPHFAPVYYGETDQTDERKPVRMSSYKIKDTNTQVGLTIDDVKLRPKEPVSRVEQLKREGVKERHSFPYEKRRFYSQYGESPKNANHAEMLKAMTNGDAKTHGVTNGTSESDKPDYIKMNGVHDMKSEHNGTPKTTLEDTKL